MKNLIVFLDEVYYEKDFGYISKSNGGNFLLNLSDKYKMKFIVPVSKEEKIKKYTTLIKNKDNVIPLGEWNSLISFMKKYFIYKRMIKKKIMTEIKTTDCVFIRLPSIPGLIIAKQAKKFNKKIIFHIAGDIKDSYKTGKYKGINNLIAKVVGNLVHNQTVRFLKHYNNVKVLCTGNKLIEDYKKYNAKLFIDNEFSINKSSFSKKEELEFLYVGRLIESKGIKDLLNAWSKIDCKLNIVGYGELENYIKEVSKKNTNIKFHGFKGGVELQDIYNSSTCLIVPSIGTEGFPRVIAEAWCNGLVVISTNVGGIDGLAKNNKNIIYINQSDHMDIINKVNLIIENNEFYQNLQKESYNIANKISKENMLNNLINIINE